MNQQPYTQESLIAAQAALGWDFSSSDEFVVEIGGTSVYEIDGAGTKWAPTKGTRKYNKDAFIVIKRKEPVVSSIPDDTLKAHHLKTEKELAAELKREDDAKMYETGGK